RDLQAACGLELEENITRSNLLNLIFTSHSFFGEDEALPEHYHFVGPVIRKRPGNVPFDWDSLNATRHPHKIFVSIGTTFDHSEKRDFFTKVVEAFAGEPVFVIVVSDPDLLESWPENFLVQPKVPQLELLPHLDAVVCHAGHNTVCETLNNGLPMVVLPIAYDQQHVAGRVAAIKAGMKLNFKRFKAKNLKHSIQELLHDSTYRENAKVIRDSFKEAGGTARATVLLEELLIPSEVHE
ncbi:MAG: nucleotide disphospho-sugar-binding domain-containing protein, partial [Bacteroidota bacterium]